MPRKDELLREKALKIFKSAGFKVTESASSGGIIVDILAESPEANIIADCKDYGSSYMSVHSLLHNLSKKQRAFQPTKAILVLSGFSLTDHQRRLSESSNIIIWTPQDLDSIDERATEFALRTRIFKMIGLAKYTFTPQPIPKSFYEEPPKVHYQPPSASRTEKPLFESQRRQGSYYQPSRLEKASAKDIPIRKISPEAIIASFKKPTTDTSMRVVAPEPVVARSEKPAAETQAKPAAQTPPKPFVEMPAKRETPTPAPAAIPMLKSHIETIKYLPPAIEGREQKPAPAKPPEKREAPPASRLKSIFEVITLPKPAPKLLLHEMQKPQDEPAPALEVSETIKIKTEPQQVKIEPAPQVHGQAAKTEAKPEAAAPKPEPKPEVSKLAPKPEPAEENKPPEKKTRVGLKQYVQTEPWEPDMDYILNYVFSLLFHPGPKKIDGLKSKKGHIMAYRGKKPPYVLHTPSLSGSSKHNFAEIESILHGIATKEGVIDYMLAYTVIDKSMLNLAEKHKVRCLICDRIAKKGVFSKEPVFERSETGVWVLTTEDLVDHIKKTGKH